MELINNQYEMPEVEFIILNSREDILSKSGGFLGDEDDLLKFIKSKAPQW